MTLSHTLTNDLISVDLDTCLFQLGLFILREENIDDMIKDVDLPDEKTLEEMNLKRNPVYFGPPVNHHTIQHLSLQTDFLNTAYDKSGEHSITDNNKIQVALYSLRKYDKANEPKGYWLLESFYSVDYKTSDLKNHSNMIKHPTMIGQCVMVKPAEISFKEYSPFSILSTNFIIDP